MIELLEDMVKVRVYMFIYSSVMFMFVYVLPSMSVRLCMYICAYDYPCKFAML